MVLPSLPYQGIARRRLCPAESWDGSDQYFRDIDTSSLNFIQEEDKTSMQVSFTSLVSDSTYLYRGIVCPPYVIFADITDRRALERYAHCFKNNEVRQFTGTCSLQFHHFLHEEFEYEVYTDSNGNLNRITGPAGTLRRTNSGDIVAKVWCRHGILHRDDGPAIVIRDNRLSSEGEPYYSHCEWFSNGVRHCANGPAVYCDEDLAYFFKGQRIPGWVPKIDNGKINEKTGEEEITKAFIVRIALEFDRDYANILMNIHNHQEQ